MEWIRSWLTYGIAPWDAPILNLASRLCGEKETTAYVVSVILPNGTEKYLALSRVEESNNHHHLMLVSDPADALQCTTKQYAENVANNDDIRQFCRSFGDVVGPSVERITFVGE